jgi:methionine aminopeptidase
MKKVKIKSLIQSLKDVKKRGGKFVHYEGTLVVLETGNEIILTTEPQW